MRALTEDELRELVAAMPGLEEPRITRTSLALELESQLARSFPASPADAQEFRRMFTASLEDDRLGVAARRNRDRIEYAFPLAVLVSRRGEAGRAVSGGG